MGRAPGVRGPSPNHHAPGCTWRTGLSTKPRVGEHGRHSTGFRRSRVRIAALRPLAKRPGRALASSSPAGSGAPVAHSASAISRVLVAVAIATDLVRVPGAARAQAERAATALQLRQWTHGAPPNRAIGLSIGTILGAVQPAHPHARGASSPPLRGVGSAGAVTRRPSEQTHPGAERSDLREAPDEAGASGSLRAVQAEQPRGGAGGAHAPRDDAGPDTILRGRQSASPVAGEGYRFIDSSEPPQAGHETQGRLLTVNCVATSSGALLPRARPWLGSRRSG